MKTDSILKILDGISNVIGVLLILISAFLIFSSVILGNAGGFSSSNKWLLEGLTYFSSGLIHLIPLQKVDGIIKRILVTPILIYCSIQIFSRLNNEFSERTYDDFKKCIGYGILVLSFNKLFCILIDWSFSFFRKSHTVG